MKRAEIMTWRQWAGVGLLTLSLSNAAWARSCHEQYFLNTPPQIINTKLTQQNYDLCFNGFAVKYSGVTRTPLWAAEYLTRDRLIQARTLDRQGNFHEENRLPPEVRATLADYRSSGFDRGHMAPNGDMATRAQQFDSFSLANMIPQAPQNNREVWRNVEEATRALGQQEEQVYVVTGPAYLGSRIQRIGNVLVPSYVWKAVYYPKRNAGSAYFAPNDDSGQVEVISLRELTNRVGIDPFPAVSDAIKQRRVDLPTAASKVSRDTAEEPLTPSTQTAPWWMRLLRGIFGQ